jgi:hypothetical protein
LFLLAAGCLAKEGKKQSFRRGAEEMAQALDAGHGETLEEGDAKLLIESLNFIRLAAGRILDEILEDPSLPEVRAA